MTNNKCIKVYLIMTYIFIIFIVHEDIVTEKIKIKNAKSSLLSIDLKWVLAEFFPLEST